MAIPKSVTKRQTIETLKQLAVANRQTIAGLEELTSYLEKTVEDKDKEINDLKKSYTAAKVNKLTKALEAEKKNCHDWMAADAEKAQRLHDMSAKIVSAQSEADYLRRENIDLEGQLIKTKAAAFDIIARLMK